MNKSKLDHIRGLLFDLDGVLFVGDQVIPGAVETVTWLKSRMIPCLFTTNTTTKSLHSLHDKLTALSLPIEKREILAATTATVKYLRRVGSPVCHLLMENDTKRDFAEFSQSEEHPDVIVIGDIGDKWNYGLLNRLFNMIVNGSRLVAIHKGRYWQVNDGLRMDIGAFIAGLEFVTGQAATVIGKPSRSFFEIALEELGLPASQVAMIGDDIENDIAGAQEVGISGILVKTGKYREELVKLSKTIPNYVVDSVADLQKLLSKS